MTAPAVVTGAALAEQYRQAQSELSARTMRQMMALWAYYVERPEARQPAWLEAAIAVVRRDRAQSARYAADFLTAYRYIEVGPRPAVSFTPRALSDINVEQVITSLQVTGPVALQNKIEELNRPRRTGNRADDPVIQPSPVTRLHPRSEAALTVGAGNARAAQRLVLDGGRDTIDDTIKRDPVALGWIRMTDGAPCYFCAVLASRGPVYAEDSFDDSDPRFHGPGDHKVHDGCACTLMPVYSRENNPLLDRHKEFEAQWYALPQKDRNVKGFRRMYEGRGEYRV